jgi:hypothetical protein
LAVFPQISFVANKELLNVIVGMLGNILHPVLSMFLRKRLIKYSLNIYLMFLNVSLSVISYTRTMP